MSRSEQGKSAALAAEQGHAHLVEQARAAWSEGGLVLFPTETVYGLGALASSDRGWEAMAEAFGPGPHRFAVHLGAPEEAGWYVDLEGSWVLRRLVRRCFPGPVTLVVETPPELVERKWGGLGLECGRERIYSDGAVALRCPDHELTQALLAGSPGPVVAAGARGHGGRPAGSLAEVSEPQREAAALVVDSGSCRFGKPSTVVRVSGDRVFPQVTVAREGVYDERFIRKLMRWTLLLVCSGNTCRSPMAEGLARQILAEQQGLPVSQLDEAGLCVRSAGVSAMSGAPPTPEAVEAVAEEGIDIAEHRSQPLTPQLVQEADLILTMTRAHRETLVQHIPQAAERTFTLDPENDVDDPIGGDAQTYRQTARKIREHLTQRLKEQQP